MRTSVRECPIAFPDVRGSTTSCGDRVTLTPIGVHGAASRPRQTSKP